MAANDSPTIDLEAIPEGPAGVAVLHAFVTGNTNSSPESVRLQEQAVTQLVTQLVKLRDANALRQLLSELRPFFAVIPKAKTAKLVRLIIDSVAQIPDSAVLQVEICKEQVAWARTEKRTFLRQRIELRLASLHLDLRDFPAALELIGSLSSEVKKLDDKLLLVDIHLLESKIHHLLRNMPKARAALTAARTAANAIYVPVPLQAEIDCQSGTLAAEEKDYKTAFSYFFEGFEQYSALGDEKHAVQLLKYMLLTKIMLGDAADVPALISSKAGLKWAGPGVDAMRAVARASQDRSLAAFQAALSQYPAELVQDLLMHSHLSTLYDTLLEQNLMRLIEPFSRVEIAHVAKLIALPVDAVESKLSQMVLDKKLNGTLDQGAGCLELFESVAADSVYPAALEIVEGMGRVVDTLFARSQTIVAV